MTLITITCFININLLLAKSISSKRKKKKRNVCLSHDHHPLNICISTSKSIDRLLLLLLKQAPSKCQSDLYCEHTLCKEHDDVDNDEKIPFLSNRTKKRIQR
jgi:hypothetical protein